MLKIMRSQGPVKALLSCCVVVDTWRDLDSVGSALESMKSGAAEQYSRR
jgi:hypothetical protein